MNLFIMVLLITVLSWLSGFFTARHQIKTKDLRINKISS